MFSKLGITLGLVFAGAFISQLPLQRVNAGEVSSPLTGTFGSVGELSGVGFYGQTFVSPGGMAKELTMFVGPTVDRGGVKFRILLTEVSADGGMHPTTVLFESNTLTKFFKFPLVAEPFTVDLGGIPLAEGDIFALVLDFCSEFDGIRESTDVGTGNFPDGVGIRTTPNPTPPVPCQRENFFVGGAWLDGPDLAFTLILEDTSALAVPVDVKPDSCPNPLNTLSSGMLSVAIAGSADLDVRTIDVTSIRLEGVAPIKAGFQDVTTPYEPFLGKEDANDCNNLGPDGVEDLVVKFRSQEVVSSLGTEVERGDVLLLELTGTLMEDFGGDSIQGEDVIVIVGRKRP